MDIHIQPALFSINKQLVMQVSQTQHRYIHKQEYTCPMINILTKLDTQQKRAGHMYAVLAMTEVAPSKGASTMQITNAEPTYQMSPSSVRLTN
jgi:hypothetical protein